LKKFEKLLLVIFIPGIYPEFTLNIAILIINPRVVYLKQTRNLTEIEPEFNRFLPVEKQISTSWVEVSQPENC